MRDGRLTISTVVLALMLATHMLAADENLPMRKTPTPQTTGGVPHVQIGVHPVPELSQALLGRVEGLPGVQLGATRVSLPGAVGFQLNDDMSLAHPEVVVGGREFAHLHPDGSLHASLEPKLALAAIQAGWAVAHPWSSEREGWQGFVMIYTPTTQAELGVVIQLVEQSYSFVTGRKVD